MGRQLRRLRALQDANDFLERQTMRLEHAGGWALTFADDCRKNDRAVDLFARGLPGRTRGELHYAQQIGAWLSAARAGGWWCLAQTAEVVGNVRPQPVDDDGARRENPNRVHILGQRKEHVLERNDALALRDR